MSGTSRSATLSVPSTPGEIEQLSHGFEGEDPASTLRWATDAFPDGSLALSTTFGVGGMMMIHTLAEQGVRLPVIFIDTLYHFPETLAHAEHVRDRYDLDLRVHRAEPSREAFEAIHGPRLWERDEDRFHELTKLDPMRRALSGMDGWITGRRRDQSPSRAALPILESTNWLKINPLATWSRKQVWRFIHANDIPYNPLHDRGYASIGEQPLTTPVAPGEDERAGRWRGSLRLECGLHGI